MSAQDTSRGVGSNSSVDQLGWTLDDLITRTIAAVQSFEV